MMNKHYIIYGHSGSYNHGAEALTRTTIALLRRLSPDCVITLSTHFAEQDREFCLPADEFIERNPDGKTNAEIYAPTIERITSCSICLHIGGDNYCYRNWQRWAEIHYAALERGAKSVLWSCSVEPEMIDSEMLGALRTHHLITARESATYNALLERGLKNLVKVSDIGFTLEPESVDFEHENYIAVNISPLVIRYNSCISVAYQSLLDYILTETDMNIALVPHVLQPVDNDYDALRSLNTHNSKRVKLAPDKLSAGQYKSIISKARFCVASRTHAVIAAYSSCVPTLAVGYSVKSQGIAGDLDMLEYVLDVRNIDSGSELVAEFKAIAANERSITTRLKEQMPSYVQNALNDKALENIA